MAWAGPSGLVGTLGFRSVSLALMAATAWYHFIPSSSRHALSYSSPSSPVLRLHLLQAFVPPPPLSSLPRWLFYLFILLGRRPLFVPRRAGWLAARSVGR